MATKSILIYRISRGYSGCRVWVASRAHQLVGRSQLRITNKNLSRQRRYDEVCKFISSFGLAPPDYQPTKQEQANAKV